MFLAIAYIRTTGNASVHHNSCLRLDEHGTFVFILIRHFIRVIVRVDNLRARTHFHRQVQVFQLLHVAAKHYRPFYQPRAFWNSLSLEEREEWYYTVKTAMALYFQEEGGRPSGKFLFLQGRAARQLSRPGHIPGGEHPADPLRRLLPARGQPSKPQPGHGVHLREGPQHKELRAVSL